MKRVTLVSSGHASTCPRLRKAADALAEAGYAVRWVFVPWDRGWADHDGEIVRRARWRAAPVAMGRAGGAVRRVRTGLAHRRALAACGDEGRSAVDEATLFRAQSRAFDALVEAVAGEPCDLVYGGTEGGIAPATAAARRLGVPCGLDMEDLYGESRGAPGTTDPADDLSRAVEDRVVPGAAFRTAASTGIGAAYDARFGGRSVVVNNVFPLPAVPPDPGGSGTGPLRLCWFSQTMGPDRGLEDAVAACGRAGIRAELRLLGNAVPGYLRDLRVRAGREAPSLVLRHDQPVGPDAVLDWCRASEVGLCLERRDTRSKDLCLSNKAFAYLAAGLALACTATEGQRVLAEDLGEGAILYEPGDAGALAGGLLRWDGDREALRRARRASREAAVRRWNWDHPLEKGALLEAVRRAVGGP